MHAQVCSNIPTSNIVVVVAFTFLLLVFTWSGRVSNYLTVALAFFFCFYLYTLDIHFLYFLPVS